MLLTAEEVAKRLGLREAQVYNLVRASILPAVKLGRLVRFSEDAIARLIEQGGRSFEGGWRRRPPEPTRSLRR